MQAKGNGGGACFVAAPWTSPYRREGEREGRRGGRKRGNRSLRCVGCQEGVIRRRAPVPARSGETWRWAAARSVGCREGVIRRRPPVPATSGETWRFGGGSIRSWIRSCEEVGAQACCLGGCALPLPRKAKGTCAVRRTAAGQRYLHLVLVLYPAWTVKLLGLVVGVSPSANTLVIPWYICLALFGVKITNVHCRSIWYFGACLPPAQVRSHTIYL